MSSVWCKTQSLSHILSLSPLHSRHSINAKQEREEEGEAAENENAVNDYCVGEATWKEETITIMMTAATTRSLKREEEWKKEEDDDVEEKKKKRRRRKKEKKKEEEKKNTVILFLLLHAMNAHTPNSLLYYSSVLFQ